jgi:adenine-specific DNA-methyltransferase
VSSNEQWQRRRAIDRFLRGESPHYGRTKDAVGDIFVPLTQDSIDRYYKHKDENLERRGPFRIHVVESMKSFEERANLRFPIMAPDGTSVMPKRQWRWSPARVDEAAKAGELHFSKDRDGNWVISSKQYLRDEGGQRDTKFFSVIDDVYTQDGTNEIVELFGDAQVFGFPKPSKLIAKLLQFAAGGTGENLVLDFFAGSGATAHAVLDLNRHDGGNRRFILVELPEPTGRNDCPTIADIAKERVRRVIKKLNDEAVGELNLDGNKNQDRGFRVYKLAESNFKPWNAQVKSEGLEQQLDLHVDHVRDGRTPDDILYEILLKTGFPLTTPIEKLTLAGMTVYSVAGGVLFVCLEWKLTLELIRAMGDRKPERVVCLDQGFAGNDQLKANAVQIFKTKGITSFKTV